MDQLPRNAPPSLERVEPACGPGTQTHWTPRLPQGPPGTDDGILLTKPSVGLASVVDNPTWMCQNPCKSLYMDMVL